ncbi:hypothetical protein BKA70DRAFT_167595 [Coprinopsis sp. MPI-PUGE-AT-0042]|nr:hypothetical protein BKA70DRAFT_167595 [Coprinopsis sp. MPI-PUGE-AT-0042]
MLRARRLRLNVYLLQPWLLSFFTQKITFVESLAALRRARTLVPRQHGNPPNWKSSTFKPRFAYTTAFTIRPSVLRSVNNSTSMSERTQCVDGPMASSAESSASASSALIRPSLAPSDIVWRWTTVTTPVIPSSSARSPQRGESRSCTERTSLPPRSHDRRLR